MLLQNVVFFGENCEEKGRINSGGIDNRTFYERDIVCEHSFTNGVSKTMSEHTISQNKDPCQVMITDHFFDHTLV